MRWPILLSTVLLACSPEAEPLATESLPVNYFTISGSVLDSILGAPIENIRILVGDSVVTTDASGQFSTRYREGPSSIVIDDIQYEPLAVSRYFNRDQAFILQLRGQAPYVRSCSFSGDSVSATILDLQGRKTINRRAESFLVARIRQTEVQNDGNFWHWNPVDHFTWRTNVPLGSIADSVDWRLEDADGNARITRCVNQSAPCAACGKRH